MPTIAEIAKHSSELTPAAALDLLIAEVTSATPRKGAITFYRAAVLAAKQPVTQANGTAVLGEITSPSGLVVVMDATTLEAKWQKRTNAPKGYVVDMCGEQAEYLSRRNRQHKVLPIVAVDSNGCKMPGGFRTLCRNTIEANVIADQAKKLIQREGWDTTVQIYSLGASYCVALDAAREGGGIGATPIMASMLVAKGAKLTVRASGNGITVG